MLTAQEIADYRDDVPRFAEECLVIRSPATGQFGPLRLEQHQREWLTEASRRRHDPTSGTWPLVYKTCVASWPKREGKSTCVSIMGVHRITCYFGQRCPVLANSREQAISNVYAEVLGFVQNSPRLYEFFTEDDIQSRRIVVPETGSEVVCVPCNPRTVQGMAVTGVLMCDELHAVQDSEAYKMLAAQTEALDSQICISSQAGSPVDANPMYLLYKASQDPGGEDILFDYRQDHMSEWAKGVAARDQLTLLPAEYDMMHRNAWVGMGLKLFPSHLVERAVMDYREPGTAQEWKALVHYWGLARSLRCVGIGVDRAGVGTGGDRSVVCAVARFEGDAGDFYRVARVDVLREGSEEEVIESVGRMRNIFGGRCKVVMERHNCEDLVRKTRGAELGDPTVPTKRAIYNRLYQAFKEGRIRFAPDMGTEQLKGRSGLLKEELIAFGYGISPSGQPVFKQQPEHDDCVDGLAWAAEAANRGEGDYEGGPMEVARGGMVRQYGPTTGGRRS